MDPLDAVNEIAKAGNGKINEVGILPDGSGFATISLPLKDTHWIYGKELGDEYDAPPMPFRMGTGDLASLLIQSHHNPNMPFHIGPPIRMTKEDFAAKIREAGRYAVRSATMKGKDMDFDPDALVQNLIVGMLGYWTDNGLTSTGDDWANPPRFRQKKST